MNFRDYYSKIESLITQFSLIINFSIEFEEITEDIGYIKGKLELMNGSVLYFFEFVEIQKNVPILVKYKYQWQSSEGNLLKRWDNAPHHREINTFPHHVHDPEGVYPSLAMNLKLVFDNDLSIE
jgi:hypothetical protein